MISLTMTQLEKMAFKLMKMATHLKQLFPCRVPTESTTCTETATCFVTKIASPSGRTCLLMCSNSVLKRGATADTTGSLKIHLSFATLLAEMSASKRKCTIGLENQGCPTVSKCVAAWTKCKPSSDSQALGVKTSSNRLKQSSSKVSKHNRKYSC